MKLNLFRSTGSYEPDQLRTQWLVLADGFDPQALTSLTLKNFEMQTLRLCFDPQALTSLT